MNSLVINEKNPKVSDERTNLKEILKLRSHQPNLFEINPQKNENKIIEGKLDLHLLEKTKLELTKGRHISVLEKRKTSLPQMRPFNFKHAGKQDLSLEKHEVTGKEKIMAIVKLPANIVAMSASMGFAGAIMWPMIFDNPKPGSFLEKLSKLPGIILFPLGTTVGALAGATIGFAIAVKDTAKIVSGKTRPEDTELIFKKQ